MSDHTMNKLTFNNSVVPSLTEFDNEVRIFLSIASPNRPGVYLITFEDYFALDLQQRLTLNGYEYNVNTLKYEYDQRDIEQEWKKMDEDSHKVDESMIKSISKIHVTQSPSRCYFAAALTNLFLFAAPFEERLSGSLASMIVYLFEEELINQTVQDDHGIAHELFHPDVLRPSANYKYPVEPAVCALLKFALRKSNYPVIFIRKGDQHHRQVLLALRYFRIGLVSFPYPNSLYRYFQKHNTDGVVYVTGNEESLHTFRLMLMKQETSKAAVNFYHCVIFLLFDKEILESLMPNPISRDHLQEKMKTTMSSMFLCVKGSYACRDHYIVPVDSLFGAYLLDHCCFVPYVDLLKDEKTVDHLRQTLNDLIEKLTTSKGFNKPKPEELQFAGNGSGMPIFDDSDFDENDDDDIDYSQVTHGGMPSIYSLMETMDLFKWNSPPSEKTIARNEHSPVYEKQP